MDTSKTQASQQESFWQKIKNQTFLWVAGIITAIFSVFSQYIADSIKTGLDKATVRTQYFNSITNDLSSYNYSAESVYDAYHEYNQNNGIGINFIKSLADEYNKNVTTVMSKEFLYEVQVQKNWGKKFLFINTDKEGKLIELYSSIKKLDSDVHSLNPIAIKIEDSSKSKIYHPDSTDSSLLKNKLPGFKTDLDTVNIRTKSFLNGLK